MPRDLVLGNGMLLVNVDDTLSIRDLYYPHVGLSNHLNGYRNRIGVWVDGQFSWLDNTWSVEFGYRPGTLTTDACASNGRLGISLRFNDTVHPEWNLFLRQITVENLHSEQREIRLFFSHDFRIHETDVGDTVFFHPFTGSMVHYKRDCYIMINGRTHGEGIYEYAAGIKDFGGAEGTWRDAEDGSLSMHPIEQGSVDSTISFRIQVPGSGSEVLLYWIAVGRSLEEVATLNMVARDMPSDRLLAESDAYWEDRLSNGDPLDCEFPPEVGELYQRSLLTIQTQVDRCGGILAANDTDILQTARAHYSYVWPRDGALVANALDLAGYGDPARRFYSFCASILPTDQPFFLHKYCPDGTPGASWHPWVVDGESQMPCQQDSTALVLWAIGNHYEIYRDKAFTQSIYEDLVAPAANHMIRDMDKATRLPRPSYDLWEQRRGVHLFTCCAVYGALSAAAKLARSLEPITAGRFRDSASSLMAAVIEHLFDPKLGRFVRSLVPDANSETGFRADPAIDASMSALFLFDLLPADDQRVTATMQAVYDRLWVQTPVGGLARYEDDCYFQVSSDVKSIPGNPWFVPTLWMAKWLIAVAGTVHELEPAMELLQWAAKYASPAGLLAEQIHPLTGKPLSVMPLTWSHAEFVSTVQHYRLKVRQLTSSRVDKA